MTQPPDGDRPAPGPPHPVEGHHPVGDPPPVDGPHPRRSPRGLVVALIAMVTVLLLGGGGFGAWLLLRDPDRGGAGTAIDAVDSFLRAVYLDRDAAAASSLVCAEARDEESLAAKIETVRAYADTYVSPRFTWSGPAVVDRSEDFVVVRVRIMMVTADERTADQTLDITVLDKGNDSGWWVCDVEAAPEGGDDAGRG